MRSDQKNAAIRFLFSVLPAPATPKQPNKLGRSAGYGQAQKYLRTGQRDYVAGAASLLASAALDLFAVALTAGSESCASVGQAACRTAYREQWDRHSCLPETLH